MIKIPILMYHKINTPPTQAGNPALYVEPANFCIQMEALRGCGYSFLDFHDLARIFEGTVSPPEKGVIVTFDDGFMDNYTKAYPVMKDLKIKGTIFIVTSCIGKTSNWPESREKHVETLLTLREIEEMRENGVSFQPHAMNHFHLDRLSREDIKREVTCSKEYLERVTGEKSVCFCYPYGSYNAKVVDEVKEAGYQMACSIKRGNRYTHDEMFFLPRVPVHFDTSINKFKYRLNVLYHIEHSWTKMIMRKH